jgi:galactose mutarotase-like enzyme
MRVDHQDGTLPTLTLTDDGAGSRAVLAPSRGGMVIGFSVAGRELLYLDRATFEDPTANVRGGVPVLFPSPGKLSGDAYAWREAKGSMKQHGFARNLPWEVSATGTDDGAWAKLSLRSNDVTRAQYPFDFAVDFTYRLKGQSLAIEMRFENTGSAPMPFGAGFHPYFLVPDDDKAKAHIPTKATRAFDNKEKREIAFTGFDLTAPEVDLHLQDHGGPKASILHRDVAIALKGSAEFTHWVVWTLRGRDFVCLEPWTCPGDALNTGDRLIVLAAGEVRALLLTIKAQVRLSGSAA